MMTFWYTPDIWKIMAQRTKAKEALKEMYDMGKDTAEEQIPAVHQKRRLPARARVQARVYH
jgi:hypothetical protein